MKGFVLEAAFVFVNSLNITFISVNLSLTPCLYHIISNHPYQLFYRLALSIRSYHIHLYQLVLSHSSLSISLFQVSHSSLSTSIYPRGTCCLARLAACALDALDTRLVSCLSREPWTQPDRLNPFIQSWTSFNATSKTNRGMSFLLATCLVRVFFAVATCLNPAWTWVDPICFWTFSEPRLKQIETVWPYFNLVRTLTLSGPVWINLSVCLSI